MGAICGELPRETDVLRSGACERKNEKRHESDYKKRYMRKSIGNSIKQFDKRRNIGYNKKEVTWKIRKIKNKFTEE